MTQATTDAQSTDASNDTFDRSCRHWSTAGLAGMDAFYRLAEVDYRHLAEACDWPALIGALPHRNKTLRLADIACGSGKFPAALLAHAGLGTLDRRIDYDLLDPSRFSIDTARAELAPPFSAGREYECTAQDWPVDDAAFELIWATHALYCVPAAELDAVAGNMATALAPGGLGLIAQSTRAGHYCRFYDQFCQALAPARTPYCDIDQVDAALRRAGLATRMTTLDYDTPIAADDETLLERYLQRCAFDDDTSLAQMRAATPLADYLRACEHESGIVFRQQTGLLLFAHHDHELERIALDNQTGEGHDG